MTNLLNGIIGVSADIAADSGVLVAVAMVVAIGAALGWSVLTSVAEDRLKPWVQRRLVRLFATAVVLMVAARLHLWVAAALVALAWLGVEYAMWRTWLAATPWRSRAVAIAAMAGMFAAGSAVDTWMRRSAADAVSVYLIIANVLKIASQR